VKVKQCGQVGKWASGQVGSGQVRKDGGGNRIREKRGDLFAPDFFDWCLKLVLVSKILRLEDNIHWILLNHSLIGPFVTPGLFLVENDLHSK
jgi:hypothetical protein